MEFITVQISPRRWIVAEGRDGAFKKCSTPFPSAWEAHEMVSDLEERKPKDYSSSTKQHLLEPWEELD